MVFRAGTLSGRDLVREALAELLVEDLLVVQAELEVVELRLVEDRTAAGKAAVLLDALLGRLVRLDEIADDRLEVGHQLLVLGLGDHVLGRGGRDGRGDRRRRRGLGFELTILGCQLTFEVGLLALGGCLSGLGFAETLLQVDDLVVQFAAGRVATGQVGDDVALEHALEEAGRGLLDLRAGGVEQVREDVDQVLFDLVVALLFALLAVLLEAGDERGGVGGGHFILLDRGVGNVDAPCADTRQY